MPYFTAELGGVTSLPGGWTQVAVTKVISNSSGGKINSATIMGFDSVPATGQVTANGFTAVMVLSAGTVGGLANDKVKVSWTYVGDTMTSIVIREL